MGHRSCNAGVFSMSYVFDRLAKGQRWWAAEVALRLAGLGLIAACYRTAIGVHNLIIASPPHEASMGEFALCVAIVLLLTSGLALAFVGPALFRHVPVPPRAYFPVRDLR